MKRLAEYFIVVGYDFDKSKNGESEGKVIQKLPAVDWDNYKFEAKVEMFCQPCGWALSDVKKPPTNFVICLTDTQADSYYLACLSFHEAVLPNQIKEGHAKHNSVGSIHSSLNKKIHITNGLNPNQHKRNISTSSNNLIRNGDTNDPEMQQPAVEDPNLVKPADKFAPKSLVLLARHGYFDVLKNCLSIIYSIYMDPHREISLEYVVSKILSEVEVPPIGGPRITFSVGAGDRQVIQPPVCHSLPVTRCCIAMLFKHLGMQNVLLIFSSLINDQKILLYSQSLNRLSEACHALKSLIYPLKYGNVFIPIIPNDIIDVLSTPTPFLGGIHSQYRRSIDVTDIITVDLDGGSVKYPESIPIVQLSEPFNTIVIDSLTKILNPDLITADELYPPGPSPLPDPIWQDKQLRAVFIRLFCRLFAGYRSCLALTRIRPKPVIHFNQLIFLLLRGLKNHHDDTGPRSITRTSGAVVLAANDDNNDDSSDNNFIPHLLNCMSFGQFIQERGTPYRVCDIFDEEYDSMTELLRCKPNSLDDLAVIDKLAKKLFDNENRGNPITHNLPQEAKLGHTRLHVQSFHLLDEDLVAKNIATNIRNRNSNYKCESVEPRFVPHGLELDKQIFKNEALSDKNKVIREFVANIFNNHITEALKRRNTIRQDLKNRLIRRIFIDELYRQLYPDKSDTFVEMNLSGEPNIADLSTERKALLEYQQFELVNDLMGEALRQEAQNEDSGVSPIIMELSTKFSTQLNNIRYYSNMTWQIQEHSVWESQKFWINCFCDHVNNEIRQLYLHHSESQYQSMTQIVDRSSDTNKSQEVTNERLHSKSQSDKSWSHNKGVASQPSLATKSTVRMVPTRGSGGLQRKLYNNNMSALDMAGEEMRINDNQSSHHLEIQSQEDSTIYSTIIHFINLIVNFRIPLALAGKIEDIRRADEAQNNDGVGGATTGAGNVGTGGYANQSGTGHYHYHGHGHQYNPQLYGDESSINSNISGHNDHHKEHDITAEFRSLISNLENWLKKFVDKTASDNNLSTSRIDDIKAKIEGIIEGYISNLESIYPEVRNLPKVKKVEVTSPVLLPDEKVILIGGRESVRCHLLIDGRNERLELHRQRAQDLEYMTSGGNALGNSNSGANNLGGIGGGGETLSMTLVEDEDDFDALKPLLPAQGALFITNYRVVFRGAPRDPYQSNKLVCRSFPIASLKTIKKKGLKTMAGTNISSGPMKFITSRIVKSHNSENSLDVIKMVSYTFQMLQIGLEMDDNLQELKDELITVICSLSSPPLLYFNFNISDKLPTQQYRTAYSTGLPDDPFNDSLDSNSVIIAGGANRASTTTRGTRKPSDSSVARFRGGLQQQQPTNKLSSAKFKGRTSPSTLSKPNTFSETESDKSSAFIDDESRVDNRSYTIDSRINSCLQSQPGYIEYSRLGITFYSSAVCALNNSSSNLSNDALSGAGPISSVILSSVNEHYHCIKSYPSLLAVPTGFSEATLRKISVNYRKSRLPIITWYNSTTQTYLLRAASFQHKSLANRFLHQSATTNSGNTSHGTAFVSAFNKGAQAFTSTLQKTEGEISASKEHLRYLQELVNISPSYQQIKEHLLTVLDPLVAWNERDRHYSIRSTKNPLEKAFKNFKAGGEKAKTLIKNEMMKLSSSNDDLNTIKRKDSHESIASIPSMNYTDNEEAEEEYAGDEVGEMSSNRGARITRINEDNESGGKAGGGGSTNAAAASSSSSQHNSELKIAPLIVIADCKKPLKSQPADIIFINVKINSKREISDAFQDLIKAVLPDSISSVPLSTTTTTLATGNPGTSGGVLGSNSGGGGMGHTRHQSSGPSGIIDGSAGNTLGNTGAGGGAEASSEPRGHQIGATIKWLGQVQGLLQLSGAVVDLMELQCASVAVCLEDGWDFTAQVVSLAQLMMEPYYRTLAGFWALIEKEWIQAGHKFQSRHQLLHYDKPVTPVFLQFLDAVHQLQLQFPMSFEFNDFLLRFIAYHHMSNRFYNFKSDSEAEFMHWVSSQQYSMMGSAPQMLKDNSIWEYIKQHHDEWPIFFNFNYCEPPLSQRVLRASTELSQIDIWEYYLDEDLSHGSVYDLDHFSPSYRKRNSQHYDPVVNGAFNNSYIERVYAIMGLREGCEVRNWQKLWRDSQAQNQSELEELMSFIGEADGADSTLKITPSSTKVRLESEATAITKRHDYQMKMMINRLNISRAFIEADHRAVTLLRLGKKAPVSEKQTNPITGNSTGSSPTDKNITNNGSVASNYITIQSNGHQFRQLTNTSNLIVCAICKQPNSTNSPSSNTLLSCSLCNRIICHTNCIPKSPQCTTSTAQSQSTSHNKPPVSRPPPPQIAPRTNNNSTRPGSMLATSIYDNSQPSPIIPSSPILLPASSSSVNSPPQQQYHHNSSSLSTTGPLNNTASRIYDTNNEFAGELYKLSQHAFYSNWHRKYFVLDSIRHMIFYYDYKENIKTNMRSIDLQEITGVRVLKNIPGSTKRFPEFGFLELQTEDRTYRLASEDPAEISEWVEKIQTCIQ